MSFIKFIYSENNLTEIRRLIPVNLRMYSTQDIKYYLGKQPLK